MFSRPNGGAQKSRTPQHAQELLNNTEKMPLESGFESVFQKQPKEEVGIGINHTTSSGGSRSSSKGGDLYVSHLQWQLPATPTNHIC